MENFFQKAVYKPISIIANVGMGLVVILMISVAADVILRIFFNFSIVGSHELAEFLLLAIVFSALAYTATQKGHVAVDLVFSTFKPKIQLIVESITTLFSFTISSLITWQAFVYGLETKMSGVLSPTLNMPIFPFIFITSIGMGMLSIVMLKEFCSSIIALVKRK